MVPLCFQQQKIQSYLDREIKFSMHYKYRLTALAAKGCKEQKVCQDSKYKPHSVCCAPTSPFCCPYHSISTQLGLNHIPAAKNGIK